jgi:hypothetical protein
VVKILCVRPYLVLKWGMLSPGVLRTSRGCAPERYSRGTPLLGLRRPPLWTPSHLRTLASPDVGRVRLSLIGAPLLSDTGFEVANTLVERQSKVLLVQSNNPVGLDRLAQMAPKQSVCLEIDEVSQDEPQVQK